MTLDPLNGNGEPPAAATAQLQVQLPMPVPSETTLSFQDGMRVVTPDGTELIMVTLANSGGMLHGWFTREACKQLGKDFAMRGLGLVSG